MYQWIEFACCTKLNRIANSAIFQILQLIGDTLPNEVETAYGPKVVDKKLWNQASALKFLDRLFFVKILFLWMSGL